MVGGTYSGSKCLCNTLVNLSVCVRACACLCKCWAMAPCRERVHNRGISHSAKHMDGRIQRGLGLTRNDIHTTTHTRVMNGKRERNAARWHNRAAEHDSTHMKVLEDSFTKFYCVFLLLSNCICLAWFPICFYFLSFLHSNTYGTCHQMIKQLCNWGRIWSDSLLGWVM